MKKSAVLLVAVGVAFLSCGKARNTLVVTNRSGVTAEQLVVTVCGKDYLFGELKNGATASQNFAAKNESTFVVSVLLADGETATNGFGQVTAGASGVRAEIEITEEGKIVGKQL